MARAVQRVAARRCATARRLDPPPISTTCDAMQELLPTMLGDAADELHTGRPSARLWSHDCDRRHRVARRTAAAAIRPFRVNVPEADLVDLRRRITATQWPERETVNDASQGVQLATMQQLARYWATDYDWRKCEAKLNALPNFITEIDGLDIHFIHVRSKHENALPLIVTHGWPGSIVEQLKIIGPLTDPTAHGGERSGRVRRGDPVHAGLRVLGQADRTGWGPDHIARAWDVLMKRLGYDAVRRPGRRLGRAHRRSDGRAGASGIARHPHQHARLFPRRHRQRRSSPGARRRRVSRDEEKAATRR